MGVWGGHFPGGSAGKASTCNAGDIGLISGLGRCSAGGHGNPPQYSCLENTMDRGVWRATDPGVAKSRTRLKGLSMHAGITFLKFFGGVWGGGLKTLPATEHRLLHLGRWPFPIIFILHLAVQQSLDCLPEMPVLPLASPSALPRGICHQ